MDTLQHHLQLYHVAAEQLTQYLHTLPAHAWHHPSTCEAWEVRDVVGHLVWGAELHLRAIARGVQGDVSPPEEASLAAAGRDAWSAVSAHSAIACRERLGEQLLATFETRLAQLHHLLASLSPQDGGKPCALPRGLRPARLFAPAWVTALAIHGWDIRSPLDPTAPLLAESVPRLLAQIPRLGSFRPGLKLATPIRYRFALTGADPSVHNILVGRCFRTVDFVSEAWSTLVAIAEEAKHQSVPGRRCGKTSRATHESLEPGAPMAGLACDRLGRGIANRGLLGSALALVGAPPVRVKSWAAKRVSPGLPLETHLLLPSPTDIRPRGAPVVSNGLPAPLGLRVLPP
jgi:uncharacterized protein (TIGR03083 family)